MVQLVGRVPGRSGVLATDEALISQKLRSSFDADGPGPNTKIPWKGRSTLLRRHCWDRGGRGIGPINPVGEIPHPTGCGVDDQDGYPNREQPSQDAGRHGRHEGCASAYQSDNRRLVRQPALFATDLDPLWGVGLSCLLDDLLEGALGVAPECLDLGLARIALLRRWWLTALPTRP